MTVVLLLNRASRLYWANEGPVATEPQSAGASSTSIIFDIGEMYCARNIVLYILEVVLPTIIASR